MRNSRFLTVLSLTLGLSAPLFATCTGGGDPCNTPRNGVVTGFSATKIGAQVQNSATPNVTQSAYFFQATTLGAPQNVGTLNLQTVIVLEVDLNATSPLSNIARNIAPLLASTNYTLYAKACPPSSDDPTDAGCSAWVAIGAQRTADLTNAGFRNIASGDTAPQQFTARTNATQVTDQDNVSGWQITQIVSSEVADCLAMTKTLQPFPDTGDASQLVTSADCAELVPNRPYQLTERLVYPPTQFAPTFTSPVFYTQAATPVAGNVTAVTHCSATLDFTNSSANPANPANTNYLVNIGGAVVPATSPTRTVPIAGGNFSDGTSVTFNNLLDGRTYAPNVTALNRGGASWRNSSPDSFAGFTTVSWGGTFTLSSGTVTTTAASLVVSGVNLAGVTAWQIVTVPAVSGLPSGNAANLNGTHLITGLTPNTQYTIRMTVSEGSLCNSSLPATALSFATDAVIPQAAVPPFDNIAQTTMRVNWTDPTLNPNGSIYEVVFCTDAAFTTGCQPAALPAKPTFNATFNSLTPATDYFARVRTRNVSRSGGGEDSAWLNIGTAKTLAAGGPYFTTPPSLTFNPDGKTGVVNTVAMDDLAGEPSIIYTWTLESGPAPLVSVVPNGTNAAKNATVTFAKAGLYVLKATISNNNGSQPAVTPASTLAQMLTALSVSPNNVTINKADNQVFTATGLDQFNDAMVAPGVVWNTDPGSTVSGAGVFTSGGSGNNIRVTATSSGISGSAFVNVVDFDVSGAKAYPVPFKGNVNTVITFSGLGTSAKIRVYTTTGRLVFNVDTTSPTYPWDVKNNSGESIASGVYLYVIESPQTTKNGKLIIIK